jgi:hypothetical protein
MNARACGSVPRTSRPASSSWTISTARSPSNSTQSLDLVPPQVEEVAVILRWIGGTLRLYGLA